MRYYRRSPERYEQDGYDLVVAAEDEGIHEAARRMSLPGVQAHAVQADLRSADGVEHLYKVATEVGRPLQSLAEAVRDELRGTSVTVTSLMPGPTATNFFHRAKMESTPVGKMPKDDPAEVARQGFEALMRGEPKVVAESLSTKVIGAFNHVLPDSAKARANRLLSIPLRR